MGRVKKYPDYILPTTITRINSPIPAVTVPMVRVWQDGAEVEISEDMVTQNPIRDAVDNMILINGYFKWNGCYYRKSTLESIGVFACSTCGRICSKDHLVNNSCVYCRGLVECISAKRSPKNGWIKYGSWPYAGVEIELEFPSTTTLGLKRFEDIVQSSAWYMPMIYTSDVSLKNGVELNTHMMGIDYIKDNSSLIAHCIETVKNGGASHLDSAENQTSGIHVHLDEDCFGSHIETMKEWVKLNKQFCLDISGRSLDKFDKWCWIGYEYIARRNRNTFECRGFSSGLLLDDPTCLEHIVAWVHTLAHVSRKPALAMGSIRDAFVSAGFAESATYWHSKGACVDGTPTYIPKKYIETREVLYQEVVWVGDGEKYFVSNFGNGYVTLAKFGRASFNVRLDEIKEWLTKPISFNYTIEELNNLEESLEYVRNRF